MPTWTSLLGPLLPHLLTQNVVHPIINMPVMFLSFFPKPNSVLFGVFNAFLRCPPWCWMVCPPFRESCLPLSPLVPLLVALCWRCVRLPEILSPLVSLLVSFCWMGRLASLVSQLVSACLPACLPACLSSSFPLWRVV